MDLLDKYGIEYHIVKTYKNGVRVGYVPNHKSKKKQTGINQTWFPKDWNDNNIRKAGEHIAGLAKAKKVHTGTVFGWYRGVKVGIIKENGKVTTIFPDSDQTKPNKRRI